MVNIVQRVSENVKKDLELIKSTSFFKLGSKALPVLLVFIFVCFVVLVFVFFSSRISKDGSFSDQKFYTTSSMDFLPIKFDLNSNADFISRTAEKIPYSYNLQAKWVNAPNSNTPCSSQPLLVLLTYTLSVDQSYSNSIKLKVPSVFQESSFVSKPLFDNSDGTSIVVKPPFSKSYSYLVSFDLWNNLCFEREKVLSLIKSSSDSQSNLLLDSYRKKLDALYTNSFDSPSGLLSQDSGSVFGSDYQKWLEQELLKQKEKSSVLEDRVNTLEQEQKSSSEKLVSAQQKLDSISSDLEQIRSKKTIEDFLRDYYATQGSD